MNKDDFVTHTGLLTECAHNASIVAQALGCDIDCDGFIGDLINGYGGLILKTAVNNSDEKYGELIEPFWNDIVNVNASIPEIRAFYDLFIAKT